MIWLAFVFIAAISLQRRERQLHGATQINTRIPAFNILFLQIGSYNWRWAIVGDVVDGDDVGGERTERWPGFNPTGQISVSSFIT